MCDFTVVEMCPHCGNNVEMTWNVDEDGFASHCPFCGKELMLCDECLHADDNPGGKCDFNSETGLCFRRKKRLKPQEMKAFLDSVDVVCDVCVFVDKETCDACPVRKTRERVF